MKKKALQLLFVLPLLCLLNSCKSIKTPDLKGIDMINLEQANLNESLLSLNMNFYNPNNSKLQLKDAEGDAWLDGNMLGHFTMDTLIHIPANSNFSLPIKLQVNMRKVLKNALSILMHPEVLVKIEGKTRIGKSGFYINYPLKYEGKQNITELLH